MNQRNLEEVEQELEDKKVTDDQINIHQFININLIILILFYSLFFYIYFNIFHTILFIFYFLTKLYFINYYINIIYKY